MRAYSAVALSGLAISCAAHATQPSRLNAWDELRPESEAHKVLKRRCQGDAREEFFGTLEHVKGMYVESEVRTMAFLSGDPNGYGISHKYPPYLFLRNGLYFIEYSSELPGAAAFGRTGVKEGSPYVRFDTRTHRAEALTERTAAVRISFKRTTSDDEEGIGVFGRLIEISDDATHKVLARRRDYVWINPDRRGPHGGFICPTVPDGESLPISFVGKVLNMETYPCWRQFQRDKSLARNVGTNELAKKMTLCEVEYFERNR